MEQLYYQPICSHFYDNPGVGGFHRIRAVLMHNTVINHRYRIPLPRFHVYVCLYVLGLQFHFSHIIIPYIVLYFWRTFLKPNKIITDTYYTAPEAGTAEQFV